MIRIKPPDRPKEVGYLVKKLSRVACMGVELRNVIDTLWGGLMRRRLH